MTLWVRTLVVLGILSLAVPVSTLAVDDGSGAQPQPQIIQGAVTILFQEDIPLPRPAKSFGRVSFGMASLDAVLDDLEVSEALPIFPWVKAAPTRSDRVDKRRFFELRFPENVPVQQVINALTQNPNIKLAEPVWALPLRATPNDPEFDNFNQWAFAPPGPDPEFYNAWDLETGSPVIKYGAIDSGVQYRHPDLKDNIWVNPGEDLDNDRVVYDQDDLNGVDDDGNGVVDDLIGYDFYTGTSQGTWPGEDGGIADTDPIDFNGHGTHISGIAAAANNNAIDVNGVAGGWFGGNRAFRGVEIMCLRVGGTGADGRGWINSNNAGQALSYAALNGCHVVNCSWGSSATSPMISGIQDCADSGVTVAHAAGNDGCDCPDYLDGDPSTEVLSVAWLNQGDVKNGNSNYGFWVDVSAPGTGILNTYASLGVATTASLSGTSMATPMVCGVALLIRSMMPSLSKAQVDSLILATADTIDHLNPGLEGRLGAGRINAFSALSDLANAKFTADVTVGDAPLSVQFTDQSPNSPVAWTWTFGDGNFSTVQNPSHVYQDPGVYDVSLVIDENNPLGLGEEHLLEYIWVRADTLKADTYLYSAGEQAIIPFHLTNTQQVKSLQYTFKINNSTVGIDSISTVGTRADYFHNVQAVSSDLFNNRHSWLLESSAPSESQYLTPGSGPVMTLYLSIPSSLTDTFTVDTTTFSAKSSRVSTIYGDFWPEHTSLVLMPFPCNHGDFDCNESIDISDLTQLVGFQFGGDPLIEFRGADVNGDGQLNISDITYLVAYMFNDGPPPPA